jgi:glycosyl transferase family 2
MISWIVATHDREILRDNLLDSLGDLAGDELIVVEDAPSIAAAYNKGTAEATQPVRAYVHHDVQVIDPDRLRKQLVDACRPWVGMVGVIGSRTPVLPWWEGRRCGSVLDARATARQIGPLNYGPGGPVIYLDGLLLATAENVLWDESYPGWHLYDHDMCQQQLAAGRWNWCLTGGHEMVRHNNVGHPTDVDQIGGWATGLRRFKEKWG